MTESCLSCSPSKQVELTCPNLERQSDGFSCDGSTCSIPTYSAHFAPIQQSTEMEALPSDRPLLRQAQTGCIAAGMSARSTQPAYSMNKTDSQFAQLLTSWRQSRTIATHGSVHEGSMEAMCCALAEFEKERETDQMRKIQQVFWCGVYASLLGGPAYLLLPLLIRARPELGRFIWLSTVFTVIYVSGFTLVLSSQPEDAKDNQLLRRRLPGIVRLVGMLMCSAYTVSIFSGKHVIVILLPPALYLVFWSASSPFQDPQVLWIVLMMVTPLAQAWSPIWELMWCCHDVDNCSRVSVCGFKMFEIAFHCSNAAAIIGAWLCSSLRSRNPMYIATHIFFVNHVARTLFSAVGLATDHLSPEALMIEGIVPMPHRVMRVYLIVECVMRSTPPILVLAFGRHRLFLFVSGMVTRDGDRRIRDGAFVASLLESVSLSVHSTWWLHHGLNDKRFCKSDPRRNFRKGHVVEITDDDFAVMPTRALSTSSKGRDIVRIPLGKRCTEPGELLTFAVLTARCVDAQKITLDLMTGPIKGPGAADMQGLYEISRPVGPREKVDMFMSHSWHDDAITKFARLEQLMEKFHASTGRYPTFWLDKVCINQDEIADGLRVLPVNVMMCESMLVLCGYTYPFRLWCVWELFTLFSFMSEEQAVRRIKLVPLADKAEEILQHLSQFNVDNAYCYDPNEQRRLRKVIDAIGPDVFNSRVQNLARAFQCVDNGGGVSWFAKQKAFFYKGASKDWS